MKKIFNHSSIHTCILALATGWLLAACSAEDELGNNGSVQQLNMVPIVNDTETATRVSSKAATRAGNEDPLHEKTMATLDFKLADYRSDNLTDNRIDKHYTDAHDGKKEPLGNWADLGMQAGNNYSFQAVANSKVSFLGKSMEEMMAATQEDADIWETFNEKNPKKFLMSCNGKYTLTNEQDQTIPLQLVRAAAKIQLNLKTTVPDYKPTAVKWKFINYNTLTAIFDGQEASKNIGTDDNKKIVKDDGKAPSLEMMDPANSDYTYGVTTYSYATSWENNSEAPQIIVAIDFKSDKDGSIVKKQYAIPVRDVNQSEKFLERNHIYTINAEIKSLNRSTEIQWGEPDFMTYAINKWSEGGTTQINAGKASYLVVYPTLLILKNKRIDNTSIKFFGSDVCYVKDHYAYYYDKNGQKVTNNVQAGQANIESNKKTGIIRIESDIPTNLTVKYIRFTVYCGNKNDGTYREQEVLVKQYPLEFIQNIEGWYSTKSSDDWIDWATDQKEHTLKKTSSDAHFQAKVFADNYIYEYNDNGTNYVGIRPFGHYNKYQAQKTGSPILDRSNNHMYVVQITSTDKDYKIGHVTNIDSKTKLSQEDVVSPAFALASQLGTVSSFKNSTDASNHCSEYVEVGKNGKRYDNWRLPTAREIQVITNYQYKNGQDAVSEVLRGYSYWALNGDKVIANKKNQNDTGFVRCVHDLTPEEVQELENKTEN